MVIEPRFKGFICTTAHPEGCSHNVNDQINYVKSKGYIPGPKNVLVIGASAGYGLASRIVSTFGSNAKTIGVIFDKPASGNRTATAGWYNTAAFERQSNRDGIYAKSINGDAFSDLIKAEVIQTIKQDLGYIDLIVYSIAAPRRTNPVTGEVFTSVLKPIGQSYTNKTVDIKKNNISEVTINPATESDIEHTIKVMGGEDWMLWIKSLYEAGVLAEGAKTVAYTYVGSHLTSPIYRNGTIGRAKEHLEQTSQLINEFLEQIGGVAYVSSNKALVTQSSAAIPVVTLYISLLLKIMKNKGIDETCVEQIYRLFKTYLYSNPPADERFIRIDELELRDDVQQEVIKIWDTLTTDTVKELADTESFTNEFLKLFGFKHPNVDYTKDVNNNIDIPSLNLLNN